MGVYDINGNKLVDNTAIITNSLASFMREEAYLSNLLTESGGGSLQGACTDGKYIYYVYNNNGLIKRYEISTGDVFSKSYTSGLYGHANDMTYNPNTNKLYICTMNDDGSVAIVNPSTLEKESSVVLYGEGGIVQPNHGIAYDRIHNRYVTANATTITGTYGQRYSLYDSSFNFIKTIVMPEPETYTIQGIETDGYLIYRALWDSSGHINYVSIYDYDGNYYRTVKIENANELESIMWDWNGNWYCDVNTSSGGSLFICGITQIPYEEIYKIVELMP